MQEKNTTATYQVKIDQIDNERAIVKARNNAFQVNIKKGSNEAGFVAAEVLLAALGACIMTNVNGISQKMHLTINDASIEFYGTRRDIPPAMTSIKYRLIIDSPEPEAKLQELHALCIKWGTVTNTVIDGIFPEGELVIKRKN